MEDLLLGQAKKLVEAMDKTLDDNLPQDIADIVKFHSKGGLLLGFQVLEESQPPLFVQVLYGLCMGR